MEREQLLMLNPKEYEHKFDKMALQTLEKTPGINFFGKNKIKDIEQHYRLILTGSAIKVTPTHFPEIYEILEEACANIHLKNIPDFYIDNGYEINAYTSGTERPILAVSTGAVEFLTPEELLCVIGHECGHIKSGHTLYHTMAKVISNWGSLISDLAWGIGGIVQQSLETSILYWSRMSEFTADRAGLLACQDVDVCMRLFMKLGGVPKSLYDKMDVKEFIKQAEEFKGFDQDHINKNKKKFLELSQSHPWVVMRAHEILKWSKEGKYQQILDIHCKENIDEIDKTCIKCGTKFKGDETFCSKCGSKLWKKNMF